MALVSASSSIALKAPAEGVLTALADYEAVRPRILSEHYRDYKVVSGGQGDGTVVEWTLQATSKRSRNVRASVLASANTITESDANSTMVTTWTVNPDGAGCEVVTTTQWMGAKGVGGFFEKTFAPLGLRKIQAEVLENLRKTVE